MIAAFDYQLDDIYGARQVVGFCFGNSKTVFPEVLSKTYDPDETIYTVQEFHALVQNLVKDGDKLSQFAYYANDLKGRYGQHDGQPVPVEVSLKFKADMSIDPVTFERFMTNGNLSEDDPPVMDCKFTNPTWFTTGKQWGFSSGRVDYTPTDGQILVDVTGDYSEVGVTISFADEPHFLTPNFAATF